MAKNDKVMLNIGTVSLTSVPTVIKDSFARFDSKLIQPNDIRDFEVTDEDSANIAKSKIKQIIATEKEIEAKKKEFNTPITYLRDGINSEAKKRLEVCATSKSMLTKKVTTQINLKAAQLEAEMESKRKEAQIEIERKQKILDRIATITGQFRSLLFGGEVVRKTGEIVPVISPKTEADVEKVREMVSKGFPNFELFQEQKSQITTIYENFMNDLDTMKICLLNPDDQESKDRLSQMREQYNELCGVTEKDVNEVVEKETKKAENEIKNELKAATKGMRESAKFSVINKEEVPDTYKEVVSTIVNQYARDNKDLVFRMVKDGMGDKIIPGIEFRIEKKHVTN